MDCSCIKHTSIPHATRLFTDLLYRFDSVRPFYAHDPFDEQSYFRAAQALRYPAATREAVASALERQALRYGSGEATRRNIERLRQGAHAVVTGQQVGLYGGPVYSIYKALTAARLADSLSAQGMESVPVFWLATEDHDLHEINHSYLLDAEYRLHRAADEGAGHTTNAPVGEVPFSAGIAAETERVEALLGGFPHANEAGAALRASYRPGETFGSAFARLMAGLFDRYGVVLLDPMDAALRELAAPLFRRAIESAGELRGLLLQRNRDLNRAGYHGQVHVTDQSTLLFVVQEGQRTALRTRNGSFTLGEDRVAPEELLARLEGRPEDFSANVLLRPIIQDSLLPSLAYVGGPAELAYLAQAAVLHERLLGRTPVVVPRAAFTLLNARAAELLARYGLKVQDVLAGPQALREKMAPHFLPSAIAGGFADYEDRLQTLLGQLQAQMSAFDKTIADAAATSARKMTYQLGKIKRKAARAAGLRSGELETDAQLLENLIHPRKNLQERVYSGIVFLASFGPDLLPRLYERITLRAADHQVVTL